MYGLCHSSNLGNLGSFGFGDLIGSILGLVFWVGLVGGLALLALLALRRSRAFAASAPQTNGQFTAKQNLQAQYARGEITREQYQQRK